MSNIKKDDKNKNKKDGPVRPRGVYFLVIIESIILEQGQNRQFRQVEIIIDQQKKICKQSKQNTFKKFDQMLLFQILQTDVIKFRLVQRRKIGQSLKNVEHQQNVQISQNILRPPSQIYCQFPIKKFYKMPRVRHCIQADFGMIDNGKHIKVATMNLQCLCLYNDLGTLELNTFEAQLQKDTETFGKMDPYLVIKIGQQKYQTSVRQQAGTNPVWNAKFFIPVKDLTTQMQLFVYDKDMMNDDLIGYKKINLFEKNFLYPSKMFQTLKILIGETIVQKVRNQEKQKQINTGQIFISFRFVLNQI